MSENKFKEKQKSVNLSYPYSPQSLIWIKNNNNYDDIITFQHAIALFGKSPMFHSLHYGDGIFEGIIALKSNRDDNKINFLTLNENAARFMKSLEHKLLIKGEPEKIADEIYNKMLQNHPEIKLQPRKQMDYLDVNEDELKGRWMELMGRNLANQTLDPNGLIYMRPWAGRGEKYNEEGRKVAGLGVFGGNNEAVIETSTFNVPPYLAGDNPPIVIVGQPELIFGKDYSQKFGKNAIRGISTPERLVKSASNYGWPGVYKTFANMAGFNETLIVDNNLNVLEGGGENVYIVKNNTLITPPLSQGVLPGTKRKIVLEIAQIMGIPVEEKKFSLDELFNADTMAFSGTWTGFEIVKHIVQMFPEKYKSFDNKKADNLLQKIHSAYYSLTHDEKMANKKLTELQDRVLTPVYFNK